MSPPRLQLGADGWLEPVPRCLSPHADARPPGCQPELLVIHCISMPPGRFGGDVVARLFTGRLDPAADPTYAGVAQLRVSAHLFIARDGGLTQFVSCAERAWHAGVSSWDGRAACNDFSLGLELEGSEFEPYTEPQYACLARVAALLWDVYPLRWARAHSEIAPGRKYDPGPLFDWSRVRRER